MISILYTIICMYTDWSRNQHFNIGYYH